MNCIRVVGAREHNLRGIDIDIPRNALTVITGLSGSGKSSLAYDTIYQEGQRRFMESLSSYARQFLGQMDKPRVDAVEGLSPTLSIDQKTVNRNPRSTVGTVTEILGHYRLLMARLGTPRCPVCHAEITTLSPGQIADVILRDHPDQRVIVLGPIVKDRKGEYRKELSDALRDGFLRARVDGELVQLEDFDRLLARYEKHTIELVVDRLRAQPERRGRLVEAIEKGLALGEGVVTLLADSPQGEAQTHLTMSSQRSCPEHGISIPEMEPRLFSFNAPQGMCETCAGIGWLEDIALELLIDAEQPWDRAVRPFETGPGGEGPLPDDQRLPFTSVSRKVLRTVGKALGIKAGVKWRNLAAAQAEALLFGADVQYTTKSEHGTRKATGERTWAGLVEAVQFSWKWSHYGRIAPCRRRLSCPTCEGQRLNPIALAVIFRGHNMAELARMGVDEAQRFFAEVVLDEGEARVGAPILREIRGRLDFLTRVGLGYLSIDRSAGSLSGGEAQRIRLATQVGAGLQGVTYVLDEPSIGLHARDQERLLEALEQLRDKGNTVLVVEHDAATMVRADYLVEIGPGAGREGGQLIAHGRPHDFLRSDALTARYLRGELSIPVPTERRKAGRQALVVKGARAHNLKDVTASFPIGTFTVVTGVSGSGKSTLVEDVLYRAIRQQLGQGGRDPGEHDGLTGLQHIDKVIRIDQSPIGRTPRSNPATYTKAFDAIRDLFAQTGEARARGYSKGRFSFNVKGGRCEECQGAGVKTIEMQFLADVQVPCESCNGKRFNEETLDIRYKGLTITEVLELTIEEATAFFRNHRKLHRILDTLHRVGLGYLQLGQPSTTLSGGEAQRIKLSTELQRPSTGRTLYLLDEPTTGLHMADVGRLLEALGELVDAGNTVIVVEHNTDVIKVADHVIDLGPEGGEAGGRIVGSGTPEQLARLDTPTGRVLAEVLANPALELPAPRPLLAADDGNPDIRLRGVQTHNLRGVDVDLPQGRMSVITGVSGSGKTSLAFDTLFTEGQRRYVESLSTYARRFLGRLQRPPLEEATGLAPAIAIDQKNRTRNPRSTVATVTEIQDGLRLLYARIGKPHCHRCGRPVQGFSPSAGARFLAQLDTGAGWLVADLPTGRKAGELMSAGFTRVYGPDGERELTDPDEVLGGDGTTIGLVIDRLAPDRTPASRLAESLQLAYSHGGGRARFVPRRGGSPVPLSESATCPEHGRVLPQELTPRHFSFNSHWGACETCGGLGRASVVNLDAVLPDPSKPLDDALDARVAATLLRSTRSRALIDAVFDRFQTAPTTPVKDWSPQLREAMLYGLAQPLPIRWERHWSTVTVIEEERSWNGLLSIIDGWSGRTTWLRHEGVCGTCKGKRLKPELLAVTIGGKGIGDVVALTVEQSQGFWSELELSEHDAAIARQVVGDIRARLAFMADVGLAYLTLDRAAETLSGGEAQRIRLATQLGSRLTGVIYVLDEPTIGLHQRDTARLLGTLHELRDLGNSLVVVEHDPDVMKAADHIVDMGPAAGEHGGRVVAQGSYATVAAADTLTGRYLSGRLVIDASRPPRPRAKALTGPSSSLHNLKGIQPTVYRGCLNVVTGVSGSGKSTLVLDVLVPWLEGRGEPRVVTVDQQPIGRTPRSSPATYCDILDPIRRLMAQTQLARERGYTAGRFSYNSPGGGRCVHCEGRGAVLVEMHFLSDVWVPCEHCRGRRFDGPTLDIRWKGHTIADLLELPVDDALDLFAHHRTLKTRLGALHDVGLGYVRLGQPANTLSGGEAQRVKLANELVSRNKETCYVLDEPTTGLHFADVDRLVGVLHRLVDAGHMAVVIEHQLDLIRNADHIVDLGPEGGAGGGSIVVQGTPAQVRAHAASWTGRALLGK